MNPKSLLESYDYSFVLSVVNEDLFTNYMINLATDAATCEQEGLKRPTEEEEPHDQDDEEADEHYEKDSEALSDDCNSSATPDRKKSKPVYTGRGVTLNMLMNEHLIEPGELCMSIEYLV